MEKVMEVLNDKLVECENRINYLRSEVVRLEDEKKKLLTEYEMLKADNETLLKNNVALTDEIKRQNRVISDLKKKIEELEGDSKDA
jgi:chromosome segregation ATPase